MHQTKVITKRIYPLPQHEHMLKTACSLKQNKKEEEEDPLIYILHYCSSSSSRP
jgi:hypothetical protein